MTMVELLVSVECMIILSTWRVLAIHFVPFWHPVTLISFSSICCMSIFMVVMKLIQCISNSSDIHNWHFLGLTTILMLVSIFYTCIMWRFCSWHALIVSNFNGFLDLNLVYVHCYSVKDVSFKLLNTSCRCFIHQLWIILFELGLSNSVLLAFCSQIFWSLSPWN